MSTARVSSSGRLLLVPLVLLVVGALVSGCVVETRGVPAGGGNMSGPMGRMHGGHGPGMHGVHGMFAMHLDRCRTAPALRGSVVRVHLMDMGGGTMMGGAGTRGGGATLRLMAVPSVVPSGWVTLVATSMGRRTHELVVLPVRHRSIDARGRISEEGSLGEASKPCGAGAGDGLRPGTTGWVSLHLAPGRYELVCNEPHHYAKGMHQVLVVR